MSERMIENRIRKLQELEAQQKELEAAADAIRAELKADLEEKGVEELKTTNFIVRWKEMVKKNLTFLGRCGMVELLSRVRKRQAR